MTSDETINTEKPNVSKSDIDILIREHEFFSSLWSLGHERTNEALRSYLTIGGIIGTGIAVFSQLTNSTWSLLLIVAVSSIVLFIGGLLLEFSLVGYYLSRSEYVDRLNTIRQFFIDNSTELSNYLYPYPKNYRSRSDYLNYMINSQHRALLLSALTFLNSGLFAVFIGIPIFLVIVFASIQLWVGGVIIAFLFLICYWVIKRAVLRQISSFKIHISNKDADG